MKLFIRCSFLFEVAPCAIYYPIYCLKSGVIYHHFLVCLLFHRHKTGRSKSSPRPPPHTHTKSSINLINLKKNCKSNRHSKYKVNQSARQIYCTINMQSIKIYTKILIDEGFFKKKSPLLQPTSIF